VRIAILGATSQIAKDLVCTLTQNAGHTLVLFARRPQAVTQWLCEENLAGRHQVSDFSAFNAEEKFDAVLNFVGVGNPAVAKSMGASIFDITLTYDQMALDYVRQHPACKYIFLSSGAAYGSAFDEPVNENTLATVPINHLLPQDWYAAAKLHAECRHRSLQNLPIVDIRVFNYVGPTQDASAAFLTSDILRALKTSTELVTSNANIVRDYIGPEDFCALVGQILAAPPTNTVVDCYTRAPVEKMAMLAAVQERYGLRYQVTQGPAGLSATGYKKNYYSTNHSAQQFGYAPQYTSLENVLRAFEASLGTMHHVIHTEPSC
jgi:nucleoside-diphosphate-sugar epimerase